jgi:prolyl-tRNA editing enzyme YbaK/EbsC (Cys-tRNA(Pro) deacylase)
LRRVRAPPIVAPMSKSLNRVRRHMEELGLDVHIIQMADTTRTAEDAAAAAGCAVDQIVKSIVFRGETSGQALLFLTAGGNRVDAAKASGVAGEPLGKADAALVRDQTGFAIGGVSPFGHLNPVRIFMDPRLLDFATVWAAAGTPHHVFEIVPGTLADATGAVVADFTG